MFSCEFCETFQKIFLKECKYFERLLLKPVTNRFLRPYETIATVLEQNEKGYVLHGNIYCVKSVQIRSFFRSVFSRIWTEYGEIRSDKLQERALRAVCNDYDYSFNELFEKANRNIHIKNTHILMTEIYKFLNGLSPPIMSKVSKKKGLPILFKKPKIINNQL